MVSKLPDDKAGQLFKHILSYVNDENPTTDDLIIQIAFEPIKQQLKRDLVKWEGIREKRSEAGKASAEKRKQALIDEHTSQHKSTSVESVEQTSTNSTVSVNVNVNDSVINIKSIYDTLVAEHGNDIKLISEFIKNHKPKFISPYIQLWNLFSQKYGVVKVEKASKTREAKMRVRLNEENFDFVQILKSAAKQKFALESRWFTFDWIIQNDTNYLKVLENKYTHQESAKQEDSTALSAPKE